MGEVDVSDKVDVVDKAEEAIKTICKIESDDGKTFYDSSKLLSTTQIRKFLAAVNKISEEFNVYLIETPNAKTLSEKLQAEIKFLKVKLAYQIGRDKKVRAFAEAADLIKEIDKIKNSIEEYKKFARYIEALVAFHKFYGGKD